MSFVGISYTCKHEPPVSSPDESLLAQLVDYLQKYYKDSTHNPDATYSVGQAVIVLDRDENYYRAHIQDITDKGFKVWAWRHEECLQNFSLVLDIVYGPISRLALLLFINSMCQIAQSELHVALLFQMT